MNEGPPYPETIRVKFLSGPQWDMPVSMAVQILEDFAVQNPQLFGRLIRAAVTGETSK